MPFYFINYVFHALQLMHFMLYNVCISWRRQNRSETFPSSSYSGLKNTLKAEKIKPKVKTSIDRSEGLVHSSRNFAD